MKRGEKQKIVSENHPLVQKKIKKTLDVSITEGGFASASAGFGNGYVSPYAVALNASASQIGILDAALVSFPLMTQLLSSKLMEKYSRKKIVLAGILINTLLWIPIILTSILFLNRYHTATIWIYMGLVILLFGTYGIIHPAWFSLMGSLVPEKQRGNYFSRRNIVFHSVGVISMLSSAFLLDYFKEIGSQNGQLMSYTFLGFTLLFTLAMITRGITFFQIQRHYEPRLHIPKKEHQTLIRFIATIRKDSLGRFTVFKSILYFAVGIASPFFVVYVLRDLGYSYTLYILIIITSVISQILFLKVIGKISDRYGNILLTKISSACIGAVPFLWACSMFIPEGMFKILFLIFVAQIISGIGWGTMELASNNYIYDAISNEKRGYAIAHHNLFLGISMMLGGLCGSLLVTWNIFSINSIILLFLISGIARCIIALVGTRYLHEVRTVKQFNPHEILHYFHPLRGAMHELQTVGHKKEKVTHHI